MLGSSFEPACPVVLKFGGTSVAQVGHWSTIAHIARNRLLGGEQPLIVCSALSGVSNKLENALDATADSRRIAGTLQAVRDQHAALAEAMGVDFELTVGGEFAELTRLFEQIRTDGVTPKTHARIMAKGELLSTRLGAAYLAQQGLATHWLDAREWLRAEVAESGMDGQEYLSAVCDCSADERFATYLADRPDTIFITQGFIAGNDTGECVLLGRGGSDTSAAYFAAKLQARRLEIWTSVPGLFTTNPAKNEDARLLTRVCFDEAQAIATMGGKVLHPRCLQPCRDAKIPVQISWTDAPHVAGTRIELSHEALTPGVKAVSSRADVVLISMERDPEWQPVGFMADVSACFQRHGLSIDLLSTSPGNIRVTVDLSTSPNARTIIEACVADLTEVCRPSVDWDVNCISLVGRGLREQMPRLAPVWSSLPPEHVRMISHSADDTHWSCIVAHEHAADLVRQVHRLLFSEGCEDQPFGPTWTTLKRHAEAPDWDGEAATDGARGGDEQLLPFGRYLLDAAERRRRALLKLTEVSDGA
ncbi:MAG: aspartate kinase [Deltaproteobacteria bacterium]|nr:aspartate kinase [Deltaproteobacteria bacterium]